MTRTRHIYTDKELKFLSDNIKKYYSPELVKLFNKKFKGNLTCKKLKNLKYKYRILSGLVRNPKADPDPAKWNTKHNQCRRTGRTRQQWLNEVKHPVGYEYIGKDGRKYIKIKEEVGSTTNYMTKARYNYTQKYGLIPEDCVLIHLDGNRLNDNVSNLVLINNYKLYTLNRRGLLFNNKDLNKTSILSIELYFKSLEKKKKYSIDNISFL